MAELSKTNQPEKAEEIPMLQFLTDNRSKLEVLLSCDIKACGQYPLEGKRKTRTIYISELLQKVMLEYCDENDLSMADFCEIAIIRFLVANGFETQINRILSKKTVNRKSVSTEKA